MLDSGALQQASKLLNALAPAEIAHLLESLPMTEREIIWGLIGDQDGEVLVLLSDEVSSEFIRRMDTAELLAAAENLDLDDLADLIQELPETITQEVIESLDQQRRESLEDMLSYPEDTADGLMNTDMVLIRPEVTLDAALRFLRRLGDRVPGDTDALIVVNRNAEYLGMLPLAKLVTVNLTDVNEVPSASDATFALAEACAVAVDEQREPNQRYLTKRYTEEAVKYIHQNKDRPFFVYLPHAFVHGPRRASPPFMAEGKKV